MCSPDESPVNTRYFCTSQASPLLGPASAPVTALISAPAAGSPGLFPGSGRSPRSDPVPKPKGSSQPPTWTLALLFWGVLWLLLEDADRPPITTVLPWGPQTCICDLHGAVHRERGPGKDRFHPSRQAACSLGATFTWHPGRGVCVWRVQACSGGSCRKGCMYSTEDLTAPSK